MSSDSEEEALLLTLLANGEQQAPKRRRPSVWVREALQGRVEAGEFSSFFLKEWDKVDEFHASYRMSPVFTVHD